MYTCIKVYEILFYITCKSWGKSGEILLLVSDEFAESRNTHQQIDKSPRKKKNVKRLMTSEILAKGTRISKNNFYKSKNGINKH